MSNIHCIYHDNCADGAAAAAVVMLKYGADIHLHRAQYGHPPPEGLASEDGVFVVDFSYDRESLEALNSAVKWLTVIDHHKSAEEALNGLSYCFFDAAESGATLTWQFLFPGKPVPDFLRYIKDRDLWQWELPCSREFSVGWRHYGGLDPATARDVLEGEIVNTDDVIIECQNIGQILLAANNATVKSKVNRTPPLVEIGGYMVPCINATTLISETCGALASGHPFAAVYFDVFENKKHKRVYSLRSDKDNPDALDVSAIAKRYGGGGHKHASGFSVQLHPHGELLAANIVNSIQPEAL